MGQLLSLAGVFSLLGIGCAFILVEVVSSPRETLREVGPKFTEAFTWSFWTSHWLHRTSCFGPDILFHQIAWVWKGIGSRWPPGPKSSFWSGAGFLVTMIQQQQLLMAPLLGAWHGLLPLLPRARSSPLRPSNKCTGRHTSSPCRADLVS